MREDAPAPLPPVVSPAPGHGHDVALEAPADEALAWNTYRAELASLVDGVDIRRLAEAKDQEGSTHYYRLMLGCIDALYDDPSQLCPMAVPLIIDAERENITAAADYGKLTDPANRLSVLHSSEAQAKKQLLAHLLEGLPDDLLMSTTIVSNYGDGGLRAPTILNRLLTPEVYDLLRTKLQVSDQVSDTLLATLYDMIDEQIRAARQAHNFPLGDNEVVEQQTGSFTLPEVEGEAVALQAAHNLGVDTKTLLTPESVYPIPIQFFGASTISFQPNVPASYFGTEAIGEYIETQDNIILYPLPFQAPETDQTDTVGRHNETPQELYCAVAVHEAGHRGHARVFSFAEKVSLLEAQRADRLSNRQELSWYVDECADNRYGGTAAMETVAVGFEFIRQNPGLFSIVAPHVYAELSSTLVRHAPVEEQEALRAHFDASAQAYLERRLAQGETVESIRGQYFSTQRDIRTNPITHYVAA